MYAAIKNKVGYRAGALALGVIALILSLESWRSFNEKQSALYEKFEDRRAFLTASTASSLSLPLYEYDLDIIDASIKALLDHREVSNVSIVEFNGQTISQAGIRTIDAAAFVEEKNIVAPGGASLGTIRIEFSEASLKSELLSHRHALIVRSLVLITLLFAVIFWVIRTIVKPISDLEAAVRSYDVRADALVIPGRKRNDEFGSLAQGFEYMSVQLKTLFNDLESRVEERTEELKNATKAAENANVAKSQFLANMSHEIRTPMNGVLGMAEVLKETELNERQMEFVDTIYTSGTSLVTIINDILDFSKIEAGRLELDPSPFDLQSAVEDVAMLLSSRAREKGIELSIRYHPKTPTAIIGDAGRIRQVLTNLVGNAIKFTHEGYVLVDITGSPDADGKVNLCLKIHDTGIGIPNEKLDHIFEEFTQAEGSTTRRFGGTGLGLTISKRLIDAMSGSIIAESTLGEGSTFIIHITMPISDQELAPVDGGKDLSGIRVLIVDDLDVNRSILIEQLSSWGMIPEAVKGGSLALEALNAASKRGEMFDLAILDYHMPQMDGAELTQRIVSDQRYKNIRLIVLSSIDGEASLQKFNEIGVDAYLSKPAKSTLLRRTISKIINDPNNNRTIAPASKRAPAPAINEKKTPEQLDEGKAHILVAEDNEINRMVLKCMIETKDRSVFYAENGKVAYDLFRACAFDVVLMDVSMPEMDGVEATKAIRAYEATRDLKQTPIICLTAHALEEDRKRFLEAGMNDYLAKPVKKADIENVLGKYLGKGSDPSEELKQTA